MTQKFLTVEAVIEIHRQLIANSPIANESDFVLDMGLLESAVLQPQQTFLGQLLNPTIFDQAAAYLFGLAKNHAFENGNKRTALAVVVVFLKINGYQITLPKAKVEQLVVDAVLSNKSKEEISDIFRNGAVQKITAFQ